MGVLETGRYLAGWGLRPLDVWSPSTLGPIFFRTPTELRSWFEQNHASSKELWVGFYKKGVDREGVTYEQAVELALCFGWIDGIVRHVDDLRYTNRFSPRTLRSPWSRTNVQRAHRLIEQGRMHPAGLEALKRRAATRGYSYAPRPKGLDGPSLERFRSEPAAWKHFQAQAPSYQRVVAYWVLSAKKEATRARRLDVVIRASREGRRIDLLSPGKQR